VDFATWVFQAMLKAARQDRATLRVDYELPKQVPETLWERSCSNASRG